MNNNQLSPIIRKTILKNLDGIENPSNEEYLDAAKKTFLDPQTPYPETDADKLLKTISTMKP